MTGFGLWIAYDVMIGGWPIVASNAVCRVRSAIILILKWRYAQAH